LETYLTKENKQKGLKVLGSIFNKEDIAKSLVILDPPKKKSENK